MMHWVLVSLAYVGLLTWCVLLLRWMRRPPAHLPVRGVNSGRTSEASPQLNHIRARAGIDSPALCGYPRVEAGFTKPATCNACVQAMIPPARPSLWKRLRGEA